jgi:large subunit ribosomal protein L35
MANAKSKSHSGAAKRFKVTNSGKVTFKKAGNNHLLTNKGKSNKADWGGRELDATYSKKMKSLLPYS